MDNLIEITNLTKRYGGFRALNNVSLTLPRGKIIGLLGPNGSGKTTLIKILCNLLTQYQGGILINGHKPGIETKKIVSYLPDRNYLDNNWSSFDALDYFADFYDDFDGDKATKLLNNLSINPRQRFKSLSKGTKEKVQLVLVLSRKAQLYLFDEPIAGVDPAARDYIFSMILNNFNPEASVILSTHLISEAEQIFDHVVFLKNGEIAIEGDAKEVASQNGKSLNDLFREVFKYA